MQQIAINENELATRWGVSPKTLQRWRSEGRGPRYLKLSKRVTYPLDEIFLFEEQALHEATWERCRRHVECEALLGPGDGRRHQSSL